MAQHPIPVRITGNIFNVNSAGYDDTPGVTGSFTLRVHNQSGDWVDVNIDRAAGGVSSTGHIPNQSDGGFTETVAGYVNNQSKITRWRPGAFGIPGNGGGEVFFSLPPEAVTALIDLTVVG
jgi:hypothetical protein